MTKYVGETIRISTTALDYDEETALVDGDFDEVEITIYDVEGTIIVNGAGMTWNVTNEYWYYDWDTDGVDAGTYKAKVRTATGSTENWEYGRISLKANPF